MSSVEADGSQAGDDTLDAYGMTMGVLLKGYGYYNVLYGGAGADTLIGGSGDDYLYAENNSDVLYVSGQYSYYYGTGSNRLVYPAQPTDKNIVVYANGLSVNQQLVESTYPGGEPYTYLQGGTYYHFGYITGIGSIEIQDGTGDVTSARYAQQSDLPAIYTYSVGSYQLLGSSGWTISGSGGASYNFTEPTYLAAGIYETAYWSWTTNNATVSSTSYSWSTTSSWPYYSTVFNLNIQGTVGSGGFLGLFPSSGSVNLSISVYGDPIYLYWAYQDAVWQNQSDPIIIDPGVNVTPTLTVLATGPNGAVVHYPSSFTTGGAVPQASGVSYSIPSGSAFPIGTTQVTATATDGAGRTNSATFNVTVLALPTPVSAADAHTVYNADRLAAGVGLLLAQAGADVPFAGSYLPAPQQVASLVAEAQLDAVTRAPLSSFDQGVATFLDAAAASGQAPLTAIQQQAVTLNNMLANGQATTPAAQGLLWFVNNLYYGGGLAAAPFSGSSLANAQVTPNGAVWFLLANGALGTASFGQAAQAVSLNNVPVQASSLVVGGDGTAWFVTTDGQIAYCDPGQTAATTDQLSRLVVSAPSSSTAGNAVTVTVTALDAAGRKILDLPGIQVSSSDPQAGLPSATFFTPDANGDFTIPVTLDTAGAQTITVSSGSLTAQAVVQVSASSMVGFNVSVPATAKVGVAFPITVTAVDAYGNVITGYSGPVSLYSSDGQSLNLPAGGLTLSNGTGTVNVTLDTADTLWLWATDGSYWGYSSLITVS